jgi:hypothetical protein
MDNITLIGLFALAVLGITCATLALWCKYKDGVFGHLALGLVALCALVVLVDATEEGGYELLPTSAGIFVAMAIFMLRHASRAWQHRDRRKP